MNTQAIVLILISAVIHAWWNLRGKRRKPSVAFFLLAELPIAVAALPVVWWHRHALAQMPSVVWLLAAGAGLCEAIYYTGLAGAYARGHLSVNYALARALPVLLVPGLGFLLGRGEHLGPLALGGMVLVAIGVLLIPLANWRDLRGAWNQSAGRFAALAALGTTGYTTIDDAALRTIAGEGVSQPVLLYLPVMVVMVVLWLALFTALSARNRRAFGELRRDGLAYTTLTGVLIWSAYGLVLVAMPLVDDVSFVAAFRQVSILIGAVLGIVVLKEPAPHPRLAGLVVTTAGLIVVALN